MSQSTIDGNNLRQRLSTLLATGEVAQNALGREAGIPPSQMSRFKASEADKGLSTEAMQRLAHVISRYESSNGQALPIPFAKAVGERLAANQLVLFAGAGLSHLAPARDGSKQRLPLWRELTESIAEKFGINDPDLINEPLQLFAEIEEQLGRQPLIRELQTQLDSKAYQLGPSLEALCKLPWQSIFSTNYDDLLQQGLNAEVVASEADYESYNSQAGPHIFQLHGNLKNPHTLTEDDYDLWEQDHPRAALHLKQTLASKIVLFAGYSLSDPHFVHLIKLVRRLRGARGRHHFGIFWRENETKLRMKARSYGLNCTSLWEEQDWTAAFTQLSEQLHTEAAIHRTKTAPQSNSNELWLEDRQNYLGAMRNLHSSANLQDIFMPGAGMSRDTALLNELYVPQDLQLFETQEPDKAKNALEHPDDVIAVDIASGSEPAKVQTASAQADNDSELDQNKAHAKSAGFSSTRLAASDVLKQQRCLAIVGEPGMGKSALMRSSLLSYCQAWAKNEPPATPMPVLIRLADWETQYHSQGGLLHYLQQQLPKLTACKPTAIESWQQQPILWLLDGLDEIRNHRLREKFSEELHQLRYVRPKDRFVVTARPAAYPSIGLGTEWQLAKLAELSSSQQGQLLKNWANIIERLAGRSFDPRSVQTELQNQAGLQRLQGNPFLLTLIVLFQRHQGRLPHDRWEFYEQADRALADSWARRRANPHEMPENKILKPWLRNIALQGMREGKINFSRRTLEQAAETLLRDYYQIPAECDQQLQSMLRAAEDLIGVLIAKAPNTFGYLHLSFQEYYAAAAIALLPLAERQATILSYWDHPEWRETWKLYVLSQSESEERLSELFSLILQTNSNPDVAKLDAALATPDLIAIELLGCGGDPKLMERAGTAANSLLQRCANTVSTNTSIPISRMDYLRILKHWERPPPSPITNALLQTLLNDKDWFARGIAADALAAQAQDENVRKILLHTLLNAQYRVFKRDAARALAGEAHNKTVCNALLHMLLNDEDGPSREAAARALASQAHTKTVLKALLQTLSEQDFGSARYAAKKILAEQAYIETVRNGLLQTLLDDQPETTPYRYAAAEALSNQAHTKTVRDALLQALINDKDGTVQRATAEALASQANIEPVRSALLQTLLKSQHGRARYAAAQALAKQAHIKIVRNALLQSLLHDQLDSPRYAAAQALTEHTNDKTVRNSLLQTLTEDKHGPAQDAAIEVLARQAHDETVRNALLQTLLNDSDSPTRETAARALSTQTHFKSVRNALLQVLLKDQHERNRYAAVQALARQAHTETVRNALLQTLLNDKYELARSAAAAVLADQAHIEPVRNALIQSLLINHEHVVQRSTIRALAKQAHIERVRNALLQTLSNDQDGPIRYAAAEALAGQAQHETVAKALLQALSNDKMGAVRHAAAEALRQYRLALRHPQQS